MTCKVVKLLKQTVRYRMIFSECELTFTLCSLYVIGHPSVCRLSVCLSACLPVTIVRPTQAIEIFGNVSTPYGTLAI